MLFDEVAAAARAALVETYGAEAPTPAIDFPEDSSFGDLTINCFHLAKALRKAPPVIAADLATKLKGRAPVIDAEATSGYVNLRVDRRALFVDALAIASDPAASLRVATRRGERLLVEFSAPNTNKPQHLGHLRNNFLGDATARLLKNAGANVVRVNLINDRGIHICKSMLAYRTFGDGATPESEGLKGDHFVGRYYVLFEKEFQRQVDAYVAEHEDEFRAYAAAHALDRKGRPRAEDDLRSEWRASFKEEGFGKIPIGAEAQEMLRLWEAGDADVQELWRRMNDWVLAGFDATYARLGVAFDKVYFESDTYRLGRDVVLSGVEKGVFAKRKDGAVEVDLEAHGLGRKVLLRSDGTSVYITQDIGTTILKARDFEIDGQIWVVADEQKLHFQNLFKVLEILGYPWAKGLRHLAYGLVHLPEGRMKSREGTVVDADDLLDEVKGLAAAEIKSRDGESNADDADARAETIALSALKFMLLKVSPSSTMIYDPKESVSFEGETGPYLLYTVARIRRMSNDGGFDAATPVDPAKLDAPSEVALALALLKSPRAVERAARELNPSALCRHLVELAQAYNAYYQDVPILKAPDAALRAARLRLSAAAAGAIESGLSLLGIGVVERM
jgi:arginyl-tRNA synthetase